MSGDLFPWKFDPKEEVVEIAAHHPSMQSTLLIIRILYVFGLLAATLLIGAWSYFDGLLSLDAHPGSFVVGVVLVWCIWKFWNEISFFATYIKHRRVCSRHAKTSFNPLDS